MERERKDDRADVSFMSDIIVYEQEETFVCGWASNRSIECRSIANALDQLITHWQALLASCFPTSLLPTTVRPSST